MGSRAPTVAFAIRGPIAREDLAGLSKRVCKLLNASAGGLVACDVQSVEPDAVTVDALCRLQVAARRYGCRVRLRHASDGLISLIGFMGLTEVLPEERAESTREDRSVDRTPFP